MEKLLFGEQEHSEETWDTQKGWNPLKSMVLPSPDTSLKVLFNYDTYVWPVGHALVVPHSGEGDRRVEGDPPGTYKIARVQVKDSDFWSEPGKKYIFTI